MWALWIAAGWPIGLAFFMLYQDWLLPKRRRLGYEQLRKDIRDHL